MVHLCILHLEETPLFRPTAAFTQAGQSMFLPACSFKNMLLVEVETGGSEHAFSSLHHSQLELTQEGRSLLRNFLLLDSVCVSGTHFSGIEETRWKYSPPSLQRLPKLGHPCTHRLLRAGSRWRRP